MELSRAAREAQEPEGRFKIAIFFDNFAVIYLNSTVISPCNVHILISRCRDFDAAI